MTTQEDGKSPSNLEGVLLILLAGVEAGAGLGGGSGHVAMAADEGIGKLGLEFGQESCQCAALIGGAGVLGMSLGIESALIAYADAASVEGAAVGTYLVETSVLGDGAVAADVVVVADVDEASREVVAAQLLNGVAAVFAGG